MAGTGTAASGNNNDKLEEAFSSIKEGYVLEKQEDFWKATDSFYKAHGLLVELAASLSNSKLMHQRSSISDGDNNNSSNNDDGDNDGEPQEIASPSAATEIPPETIREKKEQEKVRELYEQQALEYFTKSQESLIKALQQEMKRTQNVNDSNSNKNDDDDGNKNENNSDKQSNNQNNSVDEKPLTVEEIQSRLQVFARLFVPGEIDNVLELLKPNDGDKGGPESSSPPADAPKKEQQLSLEERLLALNKSLPSGFKSADERMRDIHQGLNRLGLSLYSAASDNNQFSTGSGFNRLNFDVPSKSETEQVDDIIAQAKDEVLMSQHHPNPNVSSESKANFPNPSGVGKFDSIAKDDTVLDYDDDADGDSDFLDQDEADWNDDEDGAIFSRNDLVAIRDKVNEAQSVLAQLNILLDAGDEDMESDDNHVEGKDNTDGRRNRGNENDVRFDRNAARKALRDARLFLREATERWREVSGE